MAKNLSNTPPTNPAARLAWINNQRSLRGLAPLTAAAWAAIINEPGAYADTDSDLSNELRVRAA